MANVNTKPRYSEMASLIAAIENCRQSNNVEWLQRHSTTLAAMVKNSAPSGSGIDCGTQIDMHKSKAERLVFTMSFHHMDESGGYDGWTEHEVIVTPSLASGFELRITGRDRNGIKEYLGQIYYDWLSELIEYPIAQEAI